MNTNKQTNNNTRELLDRDDALEIKKCHQIQFSGPRLTVVDHRSFWEQFSVCNALVSSPEDHL